ncbi:MAG: hypothetical protein ACT4QG_19520 [Sporichthyaceae bacterium]
MNEQRRLHLEVAQSAREELARTPGWRRGRRKELHQAISAHQAGFEGTFPEATRLDRAIDALTRQVEVDTRQREHEQRQRAALAVPWCADQDAYLAPAKTAGRARPGAGPIGERFEQERTHIAELHRRRAQHHEQASGRGRDDGRAIGI